MSISKSCLFCLELSARKRHKPKEEEVESKSRREFMEYFGEKVGVEFGDADAANMSLFVYAPCCAVCRRTFDKLFLHFKKLQSLQKEVDEMVTELTDRVIKSNRKERRVKAFRQRSDTDRESEDNEEGDVLFKNIRWFRQRLVDSETNTKGQRTRRYGKPGRREYIQESHSTRKPTGGKSPLKKRSTASKKPAAVKRPGTPMKMTNKSVKRAKKQVAVSRGKTGPSESLSRSLSPDFEDIPMDYEQNYDNQSYNNAYDETVRAVEELERLNDNDGSTSPKSAPGAPAKVSRAPRKRLPQVNQNGHVKRKQKRRVEPMANEIIVCNICNNGRIFNKLKFYKYHLRRHHGKDHTVTCPVCNKSISDFKTFILHIFKVHEAKTNDKPYSCTICGKKFAVGYLHKRHEEFHGLDATKPLKCSFCEERYPTSQEKAFLKHQHSCNIKGNGKRQTLFFCTTCDRNVKGGSRRLHLEWRHNATYHQDKLAFSCAECGDKCCKFPTEDILKIHNRIHHSTEPGPFECLLCPMKYLVVDPFLTHFRSHFYHRRCEYCERWFYDACIWLGHTKSCQTRVREGVDAKVKEVKDASPVVFNCDFCNSKFSSDELLDDHAIKNHEDKLWQCGFCVEKFANAYKRAVHIRIKHMTFVCEICGKAASSEVKRKDHKYRLHGIKRTTKKPKPERIAKVNKKPKSGTKATAKTKATEKDSATLTELARAKENAKAIASATKVSLSYAKLAALVRANPKKIAASTSTTANALGNASATPIPLASTKLNESDTKTISISAWAKAKASAARGQELIRLEKLNTLAPANPSVTGITSTATKYNASAVIGDKISAEGTNPLKTVTGGGPTFIRFTGMPALANPINDQPSTEHTIDHSYVKQPSCISPQQPSFISPQQPSFISPQQPSFISPQQPSFILAQQPSLIFSKQPSFILPKPTLPTVALMIIQNPQQQNTTGLGRQRPLILALPPPVPPSPATPKPPLKLSKHKPKPSLELPKPRLDLPKLSLPTVALRIVQNSQQHNTTGLGRPRPLILAPPPSVPPSTSTATPKPPMKLPKPPLDFPKAQLDLPKAQLDLPKPALNIRNRKSPLILRKVPLDVDLPEVPLDVDLPEVPLDVDLPKAPLDEGLLKTPLDEGLPKPPLDVDLLKSPLDLAPHVALPPPVPLLTTTTTPAQVLQPTVRSGNTIPNPDPRVRSNLVISPGDLERLRGRRFV